MPVVYGILQDKYKDPGRFHPSPEVVELVCRASKDPTYKKPKFRRCMNEYIASGLCCKRGKVLTERRKAYYESIRRKKMEAFIDENRKKIRILKQQIVNNVFKTGLQKDERQWVISLNLKNVSTGLECIKEPAIFVEN